MSVAQIAAKAAPLTSENFKEAVLNKEGRAVVFFMADTCRHCRRVAPRILALLPVLQENVPTYLADAGCSGGFRLARELSVSDIPTVLIFENGGVVAQTNIGQHTEQRLAAYLSTALGLQIAATPQAKGPEKTKKGGLTLH